MEAPESLKCRKGAKRHRNEEKILHLIGKIKQNLGLHLVPSPLNAGPEFLVFVHKTLGFALNLLLKSNSSKFFLSRI